MITFFLGRIHHALKLLPVAAGLQNAGHEISFLIADNSINNDPTTEYLADFGINSFYHVNNFADDTARITDIEKTIDINDILYTQIPPFWIISSLQEASRTLVGFDRFLELVTPSAIFGLHENNFWTKQLFYLAQKRGIKTYSLQEGIVLEREENDLSKYSHGTKYTNRLFSWSEYDKRFYAKDAPIYPVGPPHLDKWINSKDELPAFKANMIRQHFGNANRTICFAPPRLDLYKGNFEKAFYALADWTRDRNINLFLKLHPFQSGFEIMQKIIKQYQHVALSKDADGIPFIAVSDLVITQTSTVALEAIALNIPVIELDMDYIGLEQPLWKHDAATLIEGNDLSRIKEILDKPPEASNFRSKRLSLADGSSVSRIVKSISDDQI